MSKLNKNILFILITSIYATNYSFANTNTNLKENQLITYQELLTTYSNSYEDIINQPTLVNNNDDIEVITNNATNNNINEGNDPIEPINRSIFSLNQKLDKFILKPTAKLYSTVTPRFIQSGVSNLFNYVQTPLNMANYLLQGNKEKFGHSMGRFLVNTFGFGVFDIATEARIPLENTSFGDTLGVWGVPSGPYIILPIYGSSNLRDSFSLVAVDRNISFNNKIKSTSTKNSIYALDIVQTRSNLLDASNLIDDAAIDPYLFMRDGSIQRRINKINDLKE